MKQKEITAKIAEELKAGNEDRNAIALILLQKGCSLSAIQNGMRKAWKAAGLTANVSGESLKDVKKAILADNKIKMINTYKDMREWSEELAEDHDVSETGALKALKKVLKDEGYDIPKKINLGSVKESIVDYFCGQDGTKSLEGLVKFLETEHPDAGEKRMLMTARSQFSFCNLLYTQTTVEEIN